MFHFRLSVRIDRLIDGLPAEPQRNASDGTELRCDFTGNWNRHGEDGLAIFEVGHHGGQIRSADESEQALFILVEARKPGFKVVENIDVGHDRVMRNALQSLVAEVTGFAAADYRRGDLELGEAAQAR